MKIRNREEWQKNKGWWRKLRGIHVVVTHEAENHWGVKKSRVIIQTWKYPTKFRRLMRKLHLDKSEWERLLYKEKQIVT